jgi:hypothetical protein
MKIKKAFTFRGSAASRELKLVRQTSVAQNARP